MSRTCGGSSVAVLLAAATALLLLGSRGSADDMWMTSGMDWSLITFKLTIAIVVIVGYVLLTVGVEAWVLASYLRCGFWPGLAYSLLMNLASGGVGAAWWFLGGQVGWKTAVVHHQWVLAGAHVVRSFLVTLAIEALVLLGLLRREPDTKRVLKAAALANAISYVLVLALLVTATAMWPKDKPSEPTYGAARLGGGVAQVHGPRVRPTATDALLSGPAPVALLAANVPHSVGLQDAARRGDVTDVRRQLRLGAQVNERDYQGLTALHWAAAAGHVAVARALIEAGADVDAPSPEGVTPLHVAAHMGHREVADLLIARGADANARDHQGRTAADWAARGAAAR